MTCELCNSSAHAKEFHDTEILNWLNEEPARGGGYDTMLRNYHAYKRRQDKNYPGVRADVWKMIHIPAWKW